MCTVSMVGDGWRDDFPNRFPNFPTQPNFPMQPTYPFFPQPSNVSREEFDALKKEMQDLKELIKAAKKFDEATGQKNCELEDKIAFIKSVADFVGVNFDDVFKK